MPRRSFLAIGCIATSALVLTCGTAGAQAVRFEALPIYPGGTGAVALGVSRDGSVAVGQTNTRPGDPPPIRYPQPHDPGEYEAAAWRNGQLTTLGDLPGPDVNSSARAASADGGVIVGAGNSVTTDAAGIISSANARAVRWVSGAISALPDTTLIRPLEATGVSSEGSVIVGRGKSLLGNQPEEAFRWSNGVTTGLGRLSETDYSRAFGVSADGSIVVGDSASFSGSGRSEGFRWENGVMTALGSTPGNTGSTANAVSADGRVVVGLAFGPNGSPAFRWENGVMEALSGLGQGGDALAVSGDGSVIVGWAAVPGQETAAFVWDAAHGMRSLQDLLQNQYGEDLTGWKLSGASGISDDGRTIVGYGIDPAGTTQAFRVTLPEPGGLLVLMPIAMAMLKRRRARGAGVSPAA